MNFIPLFLLCTSPVVQSSDYRRPEMTIPKVSISNKTASGTVLVCQKSLLFRKRLQGLGLIYSRSKCGNNSARSTEQQDMQAVGLFSIPETFVVRGKIFLFFFPRVRA